jgi:hypothetical protein
MYFSTHVLTGSWPRNRKINPSNKLGDDNSEVPLLSSQQKSVADKAAADAAAKAAADAPESGPVPESTVVVPDAQPEVLANKGLTMFTMANSARESSPEITPPPPLRPTTVGKQKATGEITVI